MRFALQHLLLWLLCCLLLAALNTAVGGSVTLSQGIFSFAVTGIGAIWAIRLHRKNYPEVPIAPSISVLKGIVAAVLLSVGIGFIFGFQHFELCTRTHCQRICQNVGVLNFQRLKEDNEARFIREALGFSPSERNWVPVTEYSIMGIGDWMPTFRYPMLGLEMDDLQVLSLLRPVKRSHSLFLLDNPLDCKFAHIRDKVLWELRYRMGQNGGQRRLGTDQKIVDRWWQDFEPLLRPLQSHDNLKQAIVDYRAIQRSDDFDLFTQEYMDQELAPFATTVNLAP
jgi:hypothetical protein